MSNEVTDDQFRNAPSPEVRPRENLVRYPEVQPRDPATAAAFYPEVQPRTVRPPVSEIVDLEDLSAFVSRLSGLGATLDQIDAVKEKWDTWDADNDGGLTRFDLVRLDDRDLAGLIADSTAEYATNTSTEEEQAEAEYRKAVAATLNEAELRVVNGHVDSILSWVGDDRVRARAAWLAEQTIEGHTPRKGIVFGLGNRFGFTAEPVEVG